MKRCMPGEWAKAAIEVMRGEDQALSVQEIHSRIVEWGLFHSHNQDAVKALRTQMDNYCDNARRPQRTGLPSYFHRVGKKFELLYGDDLAALSSPPTAGVLPKPVHLPPAPAFEPQIFGIEARQANDLQASPERLQTTISRIVRDTRLANSVKALHRYECQICGHTIALPDGSRYSEGHHLQPLGAPHNGPDVMENIVCLCPNHHAMCDFGAIEIVSTELRQAAGHCLGQQFLDYHNRRIYVGNPNGQSTRSAQEFHELQ